MANNAGVEITGLVVDLEPADVRAMLDVNVARHRTRTAARVPVHATRRSGQAGRPGGTVVNIASVAASVAFPGISVNSATKSAIDRLTRVAAVESGRPGYGVRGSCVRPGLTPTAMGNRVAADCAEIGQLPSAGKAARRSWS